MSRLRTIKPGFFLDEELAECSPLSRLLFAGIWTVADREGRIEDRPKRIKVQVLPYDECDADVLLDELEQHGFIVRYSANGGRYIAVPTWHKHQNPHIKEAPSTIPAPDKNSAKHDLARDEPCGVLGLGSCLGSGKDTSSSPNGDDGFSDFWTLYPRKVGRSGTKKRWEKMTRKDRGIATSAAEHLADWQRESATELQFVPHPATFIGPKRTFEDWAEGWPAGYKAGDAKAEPEPTCPECRKQNSDMPLTYDEAGDLHCSFCGWKQKP